MKYFVASFVLDKIKAFPFELHLKIKTLLIEISLKPFGNQNSGNPEFGLNVSDRWLLENRH